MKTLTCTFLRVASGVKNVSVFSLKWGKRKFYFRETETNAVLIIDRCKRSCYNFQRISQLLININPVLIRELCIQTLLLFWTLNNVAELKETKHF